MERITKKVLEEFAQTKEKIKPSTIQLKFRVSFVEACKCMDYLRAIGMINEKGDVMHEQGEEAI